MVLPLHRDFSSLRVEDIAVHEIASAVYNYGTLHARPAALCCLQQLAMLPAPA